MPIENLLKYELRPKVFQSNLWWNVLVKKVFEWNSLWNKFSRRFRSLFGFLKPKRFIINSKINFLKILTINPRLRTLQRWLINTKKIKPNNLIFPNITYKLSWKNGVRKSLLLLFVKKIKYFNQNRYRYNLYKYKIHQYTTKPRYRLDTYSPNIIFKSGDIRSGLSNVNFRAYLPNNYTISTYNWKIIN